MEKAKAKLLRHVDDESTGLSGASSDSGMSASDDSLDFLSDDEV